MTGLSICWTTPWYNYVELLDLSHCFRSAVVVKGRESLPSKLIIEIQKMIHVFVVPLGWGWTGWDLS